jgi:hypothetical protein
LQKNRQLSSALLNIVTIVLILTAIAKSSAIIQAVKGSQSIGNSNTKQSQKHFIQICCTWGRKLIAGTLTYKIIGADAITQQAVRNAIKQWNSKIKSIKIIEASTNNTADIEVNLNPAAQEVDGRAAGNMITSAGHALRNSATAGQSINHFDKNGFITSIRISISRSAFGNTLSFSKIEQITEHEIGHALGLGHANFDQDIMSAILNGKSKTISKCDINAVIESNRWKLAEPSVTPHTSLFDRIYC